ncbi:MAG: YitT family protein [bacterium]|nr:YitT family protein [bacterium]
MNKSVNALMESLSKKNFWKNFFFFVMGMLIGAFAFNLFFDKYDIIPTGSSGLALLIANYVTIPVSLVFLLIGLIFFGVEYAGKMLAITFLYPFFVTATSLITRNIDLEDTSLFLIMVIGGSLSGLSSGLIRKSGYSPGGFAVLFDLMHKYLHTSIGISTIIINAILIISSSFVYGFSSALYALISLIVSSYVVDRVIIGISNNKVFYIITKMPLEVKEYVSNNLHYKVTEINARGGYTNKKRKMLMCVVPTIEYVKLRELVKVIDKDVFFLIVDAYESSVKKNCKNM